MKATMQLPPYDQIVRDQISRAVRDIGAGIVRRARMRLGHYSQAGFPSWTQLAPSTLRKKRRQHFRTRRRMFGGFGPDMPLVDTGRMGASGRHSEKRFSTTVSFDFPAQQHEQDTDVGAFRIAAGIPLPRRPFLWPAVEASMDSIVEGLENRIARAL